MWVEDDVSVCMVEMNVQCFNKGVTLFIVSNDCELNEFLKQLLKPVKYSKKKNKKVYENLQASEPVNQLEAALLQLPKWTSKDAKTIAEQFSYEQLAYAKETDLLKIKGIGNKKV